MKQLLLSILLIFSLFAGVQIKADEVTQQIIQTTIHELPWYTIFDWISADIKNNEVTLTGFALRPILKLGAEKELRKISNTIIIHNNIEVLPFSMQDDQIRLDLYESLFDINSPLHKYVLAANSDLHIVVNHGVVILQGFINNKTDNALIFMKIRQISGVREIENNLKIKAQPEMLLSLITNIKNQELKTSHRHIYRRRRRRR